MKKYCVILLVISFLSVTLLQGVALLSTKYVSSVDEIYQEYAKSDDSSILYPQINGSAMGLDQVYRIEQKNLNETGPTMINFGNSTSILGILPNEFEDKQTLDYVNAAYGSATIFGFHIMYNFLKELDYQINEDTIIKIDVSAALFKKRTFNQDVLVSALEYADVYDVQDNYEVIAQPLAKLKNQLGKNSHNFDKATEYIYAKMTNGYDSMYETKTHSFSGYHKDLQIDKENMMLLQQFIELFPHNQVIVEATYMHSELRNSKTGEIFEKYVEEELIPYLEEKEIRFLDARVVLDDEYFIDSTHLNYSGRKYYTQWLIQTLPLLEV